MTSPLQEAKKDKRTAWAFFLVMGAVIVAVVIAVMPTRDSYQRSATPSVYLPGEVADQPGVWFDTTTASSLVGELAAATEGSGWCLGWEVHENGQYSVGSSAGTSISATTCDRWVVVLAELVYVPESSESSDTAGIAFRSSDPAVEDLLAQDPDLLRGAGFRQLLGNDGDTAVANVVSSVALKMASEGLLEPLAVATVEDGTGTELEDAEGEDGSDALFQNKRQFKLGIGVLIVAVAAGIGVLITRKSKPRGPGGGPTAPGGPRANPRAAMRAAVEQHRQTQAAARAQAAAAASTLPPPPAQEPTR